MTKWHFSEHPKGDRLRDPIQGEFFANEHIDGPAEALVREGIQNSLDAAMAGNGHPKVVRVRIHVSGEEQALPPESIARYMEDAWPHVLAPRNGLHANPAPGEPCQFLVFEDFGTTGLTGSVSQWRSEEGVKNAFFHYLRAEGLTDKTEDERGRWGVGKSAFPRVSRMNGILALTKRADDNQTLLMGSVTMKTHDVGSNTYKPDSWYGLRDSSGDMVMPIDDPAVLAQFRTDFQIERDGEPGLSIVVPWCAAEDVDFRKLAEATIAGYFHPILLGELTVEISSPQEQVNLTATSIDAVLQELGGAIREEVAPLLELARFSAAPPADAQFTLQPPAPGYAPRWSEQMLPDDTTLERLRDLLGDDGMARVRVPLTVRRVKGPAEDAYFDIVMRRNARGGMASQTFIREGIIIPDVRSPRHSGHDALVIIPPGALACLLGDAESPSHTQWNKDSSNFRGKYHTGPSYIGFVSKAVTELVRLLNQTADEEEPDLLADFLALPAKPDAKRKKKGPGEPKPDPGPPPPIPPIPPPPPRRFVVTKTEGGFSVGRGAPGASRPDALRVRVAYDCRSGSALSRYSPEDFRLDKKPIEVTAVTGGTVRSRSGNEIVFDVNADDFGFSVTGFDTRRDLYVRADMVEGDDDQAT